MSSTKQYDIVIYGATGYTGRLVVEYMQRRYGNDSSLAFAMAGRSMDKLQTVRDEMGLPSSLPLVVADSKDDTSLRALVDNTRLVISTVGPYQLYGSNLVALCAQCGTDYVDLCGESVWMRHMIDAHEGAAKQSGAKIVFSCGFDSIPSDLGVFHLQNIALDRNGAPCQAVSCRVRALQGTFSGGTAASIKASLAAAASDPQVLALATNPYALVPGFVGVEQPLANNVVFDENDNTWLAPFLMAVINTRNVHRSNALLDHFYGEDFVYDEMVMTGPGEKGEQAARFIATQNNAISKNAPKPGEGPTEEERENGFYDMLFVGQMRNGNAIKVSVKGDKDPGYGSTSKMLAEAAVCLLADASDIQGGIWTPATAMGRRLITRLEANAGLTFTEES